jgi:hypothetical protein
MLATEWKVIYRMSGNRYKTYVVSGWQPLRQHLRAALALREVRYVEIGPKIGPWLRVYGREGDAICELCKPETALWCSHCRSHTCTHYSLASEDGERCNECEMLVEPVKG